MPNRRRNILTVAEKTLQKITERYIWKDKSWLEQYEPGNASRGNDRSRFYVDDVYGVVKEEQNTTETSAEESQ